MSHSRPSGFIQWLSVLLLVVLLLPLPGAASPLAADTPPDAVDPAVTTGAVLVNAAAERVAVDTPQPVEPAQVEAIASPAAAKGPGVPISLRAGMLDLTRGLLPDVPADLRIDAYPNGERGYYIVQFIGPVQEGWKANVAKAGGVLFDYLPDFAFVVAMDEAMRDAVAGMKEVAAIGILQPAYKLNPDLIGVTGVRELVVQTFPGELLDTVRGQAITLGAQVRESTASESGGLLRLSLDAARLADLARIPAVRWIEPFYERVLHNDVARSNTIMAAETAWTNLGLYGAGQVVAVADTGLDTGSTSTLHQDFLGSPTGCSSTGRIIATYALGRTGDWSDSCRTGSVNEGGHGTHVSGSVLGNGCRSGSTGVPNYAGSYAGLAPQAGLVMQSVMDSGCGLGGLPTDLNTLFNQARDAGARIHTNSWGAAVAGQYTTDSRNSDLFLWNNKYQTILFSAGNEGIDNPSSDGYINPDSIGAPGTAKNVITVGASENVRSTGGYNPGGACSTWGGCWPTDYPTEPIKSDRLSDNASGMVAFSSRGPTDDGRIKPDVVAPGSNILSTKSQGAYVSGGWGAGPNQYYQYMGGTSMATPLTAGAMAQIREFYTRIKGITPSGALLKATVINSAVNLSPGQYASPLEQQPILPNNAQGWGRVNVANATDDSHLWQDISDANGLATGGSQSYTYPYCGTAPLKVTLAWTDYPGALAAATELVNDLDLTVTAPDGTTIYRGNIFSNGWSATGGSADRKNPVESVYIQTPTVGNWTVTVSGYNVPNGASGKQGYGLVVDGANTPCAEFTVNTTPASQAVCTANDALYTVAVSEVGTFGSPVTLNASFNPAGPTAAFNPNPVTPSGNATLTVSSAAAGTYNITVTGTSGALSRAGNVTLNVAAPLAAAPVLTTPASSSTNVARTPTFTWNTVTGAASYDIQVATDAAFNNLVINQTALTGASYTPGSALAANTTHYWRVRPANACGTGPYSSAFTFTTVNNEVTCNGAGGNWSATGTWAGGVLPTATDQVVIGNGCTVTINTNATVDRLTVGGGTTGVLLFDNTVTARTLTVNTSVTIASGGVFRVDQNVKNTQTGHQLVVGTDLTNSGTLDFHFEGSGNNSGTRGAQITFTGAADASFTLGSGSTTDLRQTTGVTLNKGASSAAVLTFIPGGTFTVQGANAVGFLAISNGTFKISGTNSFSNPAFNIAAYTIPTTGGFWLDNPNATVAGLNGSPTNNGTLRISQGTYNIGTGSGNSMGAGAGANYVIEGGTLNVAGRLNTGNAVNYTQSGGTVNVATVGNGSSGSASFGLGNSSVTTISGGVINLVQANTTATLDYGVYGTANITGGTLNVGTSATATNFTFRLVGQAPGVMLNNTTNNKNATAVGQLNIWGALTVNTGTTLNANGYTVLLFGPGVTNNGAIVGTTTGSRVDFVGLTAQSYGGAGTFGTSAAPFLSVGIANSSGATLNANIITNRVNLFEGTFANSSRFTLGNGGTSYSTVQIGQTGATTPGGNFDVSPTFNTGTGGHNILYAQETAARTTGPEIPPSRTAYYVSVDNTNGVTLAGGDLTIANTSAQTASQLLLTNGRFTLGANNLIIVNNAIGGSPFSADKMIVSDGGGALCKRYTANGSFIFPIGDATGTPEYSPATLNFTAGSYGSGAQACVNLTNAKHPQLPNTDHIRRYWTVTQSGISGFTCQPMFTYTDADISGSEAALYGAKWDTSWTVLNAVDQANNQFTANVTSFSAFTASNPTPLAVNLAGFTAAVTADGVTLAWETVSETDNAGFNVYRAGSEAGPWTRLNAALIPAATPGASEGHAYTCTDATAAANTAYVYRLEAVALDGTAEMMDPLGVTYRPARRTWLPLAR